MILLNSVALVMTFHTTGFLSDEIPIKIQISLGHPIKML